ncbi:MAG: protein-tyrosine phosphatase family protein [Candidatus Latescibacterota bacterium]|nr:protein-tyrosine phosphatase family protein [Candidatus Latescibacterota bacterium]
MRKGVGFKMVPNFGWLVPGQLAGSGDIAGWRAYDAEVIRRNLSWLTEEGIGAIATLTASPLDKSILDEYQFEYKHIPIMDMTPPSIESIVEFVEFSTECLKQDKPILVHCSAGLGRTGTMLSCFMVSNGVEPLEAIMRVRESRPGSVETLEQEMRVIEYADSISLD